MSQTAFESIPQLRDALRAFAAERDWDQFHSPKNLAMALTVEAGELQEHFQWLSEEASRLMQGDQLAAVAAEMADVFIYLVRLADKMGVDLLQAAADKLEINARRYPADKVRGSARKYRDSDMNSKPIRTPGPDHPISVTPTKGRVTVSVDNKIIVDSREAVTLQEANYPPVQYVPRKDVDMTLLQRTTHRTYCPYKGECVYYSIPAGGERSVNAAWSYEAPYAAVSAIREHLAFYPDRIDAVEIDRAS